MNFSAWSIRNPIAPILMFVLLLVLGWQSFNTLPVTRFPNIDFPLVSVSVAQPGASPSEMEGQITKEIEDAVSGIAGVKNVSSTVTDGLSSTAVEFRMEVPTDKAVQDVKDAIDRIRSSLPGDIESPIVSRIDIAGQAIQTYAVKAPDMTLAELSWFVDDVVTRQLQGKPGIGRISRYGGADREVRITLDPVKLESYGTTAQSVSTQLRLTNIDLGAGRVEIGQTEQTLRSLGDVESVEALRNLKISLPSGNFVRLSDLGKIEDGYEDVRSFSRLNGESVVTFSVFRAKGASEVSVANTVEEQLSNLQKSYPEVEIILVDDTVFYTKGNYEAALNTLIEGAILAVIVVFAFLKNWRATLISAVALPLSAIPTFWIMDLLGFSLNLISFLAITLATGILVDDAIVEIENIARHIKMGKTPYRAAIDAADEIGLAVIATTMTIVAVFVPVSFMPGIPGQYFRQFGLTVAIAVLFSLLVARLITPMIAAYLMTEKDAEHEHKDGKIMLKYLSFIRMTTKWKYSTLFSAIVILAISLFFMLRIPGSFIPPEDVSRIPISVELPPGSTLDDTDRAAELVYEKIKDIEGVENVFILGGASPVGDRDIRLASITVLLEKLDHSIVLKVSRILNDVPVVKWIIPEVENKGRKISQPELESRIFSLLADIPDVRVTKLNDRGERDISYSILSSDGEALTEAISQLENALSGDPLLANVASTGALPRPEIQIVPRADEAARFGITSAQIASVIRVASIGDSDAALPKISLDGRLIPVRLKIDEKYADSIEEIRSLKVQTKSGRLIPLSSVADVYVTQGVSTIERLNRERKATIGANLPFGVALGEASARFNEILDSIELPSNVRISESGDAEIQQELAQSFGNAMILGLLLVLTVLILLFQSVIQPFTILFSLPLSIGGVAAALILTGSAVSMPVLIGILMLMGIVTKNAILLIDFAIEMRNRGMDRISAVIEAGHKRARPIVMTSIAMSAGMLPSALGVGEGGSFRSPMATAVIGGIAVSTVLSLVIVPSFFLIMDDLSRFLTKIFSRFIGEKDPDDRPDLNGSEISARLLEMESRIKRLDVS